MEQNRGSRQNSVLTKWWDCYSASSELAFEKYRPFADVRTVTKHQRVRQDGRAEEKLVLT